MAKKRKADKAAKSQEPEKPPPPYPPPGTPMSEGLLAAIYAYEERQRAKDPNFKPYRPPQEPGFFGGHPF